jgi:hypothetical protein
MEAPDRLEDATRDGLPAPLHPPDADHVQSNSTLRSGCLPEEAIPRRTPIIRASQGALSGVKHGQINHSGSQPASRPMPGQTACESPREFVMRFGRESECRAGNSIVRGRQGPDQVPDAHLVWHRPVSVARFQHAVEGTHPTAITVVTASSGRPRACPPARYGT